MQVNLYNTNLQLPVFIYFAAQLQQDLLFCVVFISCMLIFRVNVDVYMPKIRP